MRDPMFAKHADKCQSHEAIVRRLAESTFYCGDHPTRHVAKEEGKPEHFEGDSAFSSVKVAEWMADRGHAWVGPVKNAHQLYPRFELEQLMKDWPSGSELVLECHTPAGHKLLAIGYKYNSRKVLTFLATKNSGSTRPGAPYIARFADAHGNVNQRAVTRPSILSNYFGRSNVIDKHNQVRQFELALEKYWVTRSGWFRIATTVIGITVTDMWKAVKFAVKDKELSGISIIDFADLVAFDCMHNGEVDRVDNAFIPIGSVNVDLDADDVNPPALSPLSVDSSIASAYSSTMAEHVFERNEERQPDGRRRRRACSYDGCNAHQHWRCKHWRCQAHSGKLNGKLVFGRFFCQAHQSAHQLEEAALVLSNQS